MTTGSLMKVESIAECPPWSILQYFRPALSDNWYRNQFLVLLRVAILHRFYCTLRGLDLQFVALADRQFSESKMFSGQQ